MNKYDELKSSKIKTVEELIKRLSNLPGETAINVADGDLGGYDVSNANYCVIHYDETNKTVSFGHLEYTAYEAQQKKEITYEQFKEISEIEY